MPSQTAIAPAAWTRPVRRLTGLLRRRTAAGRFGPIGLEFAQEKLHLVQMQREGAELRIRGALSVPYPGPRETVIASRNELRAFLQHALKQRPFRGRRVVTCLPKEQLKILMLDIPATHDGHEPEAVLRAAMERVNGKPEDWLVDYVPLRNRVDNERERKALVALAPRPVVMEFLDNLGYAGLEVAALEIGPVAIRRLVSHDTGGGGDKPHENLLVVNIGEESTYLTVISGQRLLMDREVRFGRATAVARVADVLEMSAAEALAVIQDYGVAGAALGGSASRPGTAVDPQDIAGTVSEILGPVFVDLGEEVTKALVYTASQLRGASIDNVYLLGSVARWPGAEALVAATLSLPVCVYNPLANFKSRREAAVPEELDPIAGLAVATGCAMRELTDRA